VALSASPNGHFDRRALRPKWRWTPIRSWSAFKNSLLTAFISWQTYIHASNGSWDRAKHEPCCYMLLLLKLKFSFENLPGFHRNATHVASQSPQLTAMMDKFSFKVKGPELLRIGIARDKPKLISSNSFRKSTQNPKNSNDFPEKHLFISIRKRRMSLGCNNLKQQTATVLYIFCHLRPSLSASRNLAPSRLMRYEISEGPSYISWPRLKNLAP